MAQFALPDSAFAFFASQLGYLFGLRLKAEHIFWKMLATTPAKSTQTQASAKEWLVFLPKSSSLRFCSCQDPVPRAWLPPAPAALVQWSSLHTCAVLEGCHTVLTHLRPQLTKARLWCCIETLLRTASYFSNRGEGRAVTLEVNLWYSLFKKINLLMCSVRELSLAVI